MDIFTPEYIRFLVEDEKKSINDVFEELERLLILSGQRNMRGISVRSLKRFLMKHGIGQHWVEENNLDAMIGEAVQTVGREVGVKLMTGHLASEYNVTVGRRLVQRSLRRVDPDASGLRRVRIGRLIRPGVYHGRFFGYNLHMDQNEKLNMYGATFVIAVDGHSSCIVGAATMVRKNNIVIYDKVFRPLCQLYGLWHRVIVDHGREFFLTLYMQQALHFRMRHIEEGNMESTYRQMRSVKNTRVERMWVYVNRLVSYPIRLCVDDLFVRQILDLHDDHHMYSVGVVVRAVVDYGLKNTARMWNNHSIPGRGKPCDYIPFSETKGVRWNWLIDGNTVAIEYRQLGGDIRDEYGPSGDLLDIFEDLKGERDHQFWDVYMPMLHRAVVVGRVRFIPRSFAAAFVNRTVTEMMYGSVTRSIFWPLQEANLMHIRITVELYNQRVLVLQRQGLQ